MDSSVKKKAITSGYFFSPNTLYINIYISERNVRYILQRKKKNHLKKNFKMLWPLTNKTLIQSQILVNYSNPIKPTNIIATKLVSNIQTMLHFSSKSHLSCDQICMSKIIAWWYTLNKHEKKQNYCLQIMWSFNKSNKWKAWVLSYGNLKFSSAG